MWIENFLVDGFVLFVLVLVINFMLLFFGFWRCIFYDLWFLFCCCELVIFIIEYLLGFMLIYLGGEKVVLFRNFKVMFLLFFLVIGLYRDWEEKVFEVFRVFVRVLNGVSWC